MNQAVRICGLQLPFVTEYRDGVFKGAFKDIAERTVQLFENHNITFLDDVNYGYFDENGTSEGLTGLLYRNECDVSIIGYVLDQELLEILDFTIPFATAKYKIISGQPYSTSSVSHGLFRIFTLKTWIMIGLTLFIFPVFWYYIMHRFKQGHRTTLLDTTSCCFQTILGRGYNLSIDGIADYLAWGSWFLFSFFIVSAFLSCLLAKIMAPNDFKYFDNVEDILLFPDLIPIFIEGTVADGHLEDSNIETINKLKEQTLRTGGLRYLDIDSLLDELPLIADSKKVFIFDEDYLLVLLYKLEICKELKFHLSPLPFVESLGFLVSRKGLDSVHKASFNGLIAGFVEGGIIGFLKGKYTFPGRVSCLYTGSPPGDWDPDESIEFRSAQFAFEAWALGLFVSTLVLLGELMSLSKKKIKKKSKVTKRRILLYVKKCCKC